MLRGLVRGMGPWGRTLLGGGAGFLLGGGGITEALMGALLGRQLGGAATATIAGAAGAAAGRAWGGRFLALALGLLRGLRSMILVSIGIYAACSRSSRTGRL